MSLLRVFGGLMPVRNCRDIATTEFGEDALTISSPGERVQNFGSLTTTGDLADGIYAGVDGVSVDNFGAIGTSGLGATGILVEGNDVRVRNLGSIAAHGEPTEDFLNFGDAVTVFGFNVEVANWGRLETNGFHCSGIFFGGDGGRLSNYGTISSSGDGGYGIDVWGNNFTSENWGRIDVEGHDAKGLHGNGLGGLFGIDQFFADGGVLRNFGTIAATAGVGMSLAGDHGLVENFGAIEAYGGVFVDGPTGVRVRNAGTIDTGGDLDPAHFFFPAGIFLSSGADGEASNSGAIRTQGDGAAGIHFVSALGGEVTNSGVIETFGGLGAVFETFGGVSGDDGAAGVNALGMNVLVRNTRSGVIETHDPYSPAILLNNHDIAPDPDIPDVFPGIVAADAQARLENDGEIRAVQTAVGGGAGDETVVNRGLIVGDVVLNDGADTFVFGRGGVLDGDLLLGGGGDLVIVERGSGTARVADFAPGAASGDVIDVSAFFSSFDELQSHSQQSGSDVVIDLHGRDALVLADVQLAALDAGDFLFAALYNDPLAGSYHFFDSNPAERDSILGWS
jgi:hypothetical protein